MTMELLLIIAVIAVVYFMFIKKKPSLDSQKKSPKREVPKTNEMVECATCGVYVEINEAILSDAKYYCSNECLNTKV